MPPHNCTPPTSTGHRHFPGSWDVVAPERGAGCGVRMPSADVACGCGVRMQIRREGGCRKTVQHGAARRSRSTTPAPRSDPAARTPIGRDPQHHARAEIGFDLPHTNRPRSAAPRTRRDRVQPSERQSATIRGTTHAPRSGPAVRTPIGRDPRRHARAEIGFSRPDANRPRSAAPPTRRDRVRPPTHQSAAIRSATHAPRSGSAVRTPIGRDPRHHARAEIGFSRPDANRPRSAAPRTRRDRVRPPTHLSPPKWERRVNQTELPISGTASVVCLRADARPRTPRCRDPVVHHANRSSATLRRTRCGQSEQKAS